MGREKTELRILARIAAISDSEAKELLEREGFGADALPRFRARARLIRWIAALAVLAIVFLSFIWLREANLHAREIGLRRSAAEQLRLGMSEEEVEEQMGRPDSICPSHGEISERGPETGVVQGGNSFRVDPEQLMALAGRTKKRFVYGAGAMSCVPSYGESELGFDADGRLIWYVPVTGESHIVVAEKMGTHATHKRTVLFALLAIGAAVAALVIGRSLLGGFRK